MSDAMLQFLVQIPIVAAFIWYTLKRDERESAARKERSGEWRTFMTEQQMCWQTFIAAQNTVLIAGLGDVTVQLGKVADQLDQLYRSVALHDMAVRDAVQQMRTRDPGRVERSTGS